MKAKSDSLRFLIDTVDLQGLKTMLSGSPELANQGIPYDAKNLNVAPPLHRICDGVFNHSYTDDQAVEMAKLFFEYGADVHWNESNLKQDSPLIAASSLNADKTGILYLEHGADVSHRGTHGGTALHWASWCGRDVLVSRLLRENPDNNMICIDHEATPLFWAIHGYKFFSVRDRHHQVECVKMLLDAGADKTIPNREGLMPIEILTEEDTELKKLLQ